MLLFAGAGAAQALTVTQPALGTAAQEQACAITRLAERFPASTTRQVFFKFVASGVRAGDRLEVEWVAPDGQVASAVPFDSLPASSALCFVTQLPVSGFAPASQPGAWGVQVRVGGAVVYRRGFEILRDPRANGMVIRAVTHTASETGSELAIDGAGFGGETIVNIAQYQDTGGWRYLHFLFPASVNEGAMKVRVPATGAPSRVPAGTSGSDFGSMPLSLARLAGSRAAPERLVMCPERSRMAPSASIKPGFSLPGGP